MKTATRNEKFKWKRGKQSKVFILIGGGGSPIEVPTSK